MPKPMRVLFVCLGNICRSPLAEIIAKNKAKELSICQYFYFESAGTGNWHLGGQADPRSIAIAQQYGLDLNQHCAQQITTENIQDWDYFIAMDDDNRLNILAMGVDSKKILMMRQFEEDTDRPVGIQQVPDPYYGGAHGFDDVYQMLTINVEYVLKHLLKKNRLIHSK